MTVKKEVSIESKKSTDSSLEATVPQEIVDGQRDLEAILSIRRGLQEKYNLQKLFE